MHETLRLVHAIFCTIQDCLNINENLSRLCGSNYQIYFYIYIYIYMQANTYGYLHTYVYACISIYTSWRIDTEKPSDIYPMYVNPEKMGVFPSHGYIKSVIVLDIK